MNLGWITGMGMKCKSPKVLEESAGENLCDLEVGHKLINYNP
jgi:hypothetical protein